MDCFGLTGKALYLTCVKVTNARFLTGISSIKWRDFLDLTLPLKAAGILCTNAQSISGQVTFSGEFFLCEKKKLFLNEL